MGWFLSLIIALAVAVVSFLLMPKPRSSTPETEDMDDPTAEAGRPMPVLFGTMTVKGLNVLHFGDKWYSKRKIKV